MSNGTAVVLLSLVGWLVACTSEKDIGDAILTDHGLGTAHHRYVVDFGPIDLSKPNSHDYTIQSLPAEVMTVGVETASQPQGWRAGPDGATVITVEIATNGRRIVGARAPLRELSWSEPKGLPTIFGYVANGGNDGTQQTWFAAEPASPYTVHLEIEPGNSTSAVPQARLKAYGGGWK